MHFVALSRDRTDGLDTRLANRPAHLDFLKANRERIRIGGPFLAPDGERMIGSMLIVEARDEADARALLAEDPYQPVDEVVAPRSTYYVMRSLAALSAICCG